jgi:hypothetical protein
MRRLAIAASAEFPDLLDDWPLLQAALAERHIDATTAVWTDGEVDWGAYDLVVANGAWDNIHHPDEFLAWAERVAALTTLVNPPAVLRWNLDKHYLAALADHGVPTVPTTFVAPGDPLRPFPDGHLVIKPTISGGGYETARYGPDSRADARDHLRRLGAAGRTAMVQPYQDSVDHLGETALIYLAGCFSHAVGKGALLQPDAGVQSHLYELQRITVAQPTTDQRHAAETALAVAEQLVGPTTYARVDLVALPDGTPAVLELELLDPALFLECSPAAPARFAGVLDQASTVSSGTSAPDSGSTTGTPTSSAKSAQAACASVSGVNSPSA